jgi:hypothetical protein
VFKIVENKIRDEGLLVLFSLNPVYKPFFVDVKEIREVWKFVHYISSEIPDPLLPQNELIRTINNLRQEVDIIKKIMKE